MTRRLFLLLACALPLLAAACSDSVTSVQDTEFAPGLGVDLSAMTRTSSGLYYRDMSVGTGALVQSGQMISVYYQGWLADGTRFDGRTSGDPLRFPFGTGWAIQGWDEGIPGMRVGGKRQLVIPPSLGYGSRGQGPIPPNAVLVFEVEVRSIG